APAAPEPAPAVTAPSPFQFVAPTPITGLGIDRSKVPAMVQTLPAEDFSRTYSPNVVETFVQRIPGVTTNNVQDNEFATDLRYRGFKLSAGGFPNPQSEQSADSLPSGGWKYLRGHALGHGRPHLHQGADDRRLVAGPQRRQGARSRQQLR